MFKKGTIVLLVSFLFVYINPLLVNAYGLFMVDYNRQISDEIMTSSKKTEVMKSFGIMDKKNSIFNTNQIIIRFNNQISLTRIKEFEHDNKIYFDSELDFLEANVYRLSSNVSTSFLKNLNDNDFIDYAIPDVEFLANSSHKVEDEQYGDRLWGLENKLYDFDLDINKAWEVTQGDEDVVVAVIDTGIDYTHSDLKNSMWINENEIPKNGIDDDNNGYIDDVYGWNSCNDTGDPMDDNLHGTHCAGTIAASYNKSGVVGVAPNVKIMALKFLDSSGRGSFSNLIKCIEYAEKMGVKITNNSYGTTQNNIILHDIIKNLNILFIVAAGNSSKNNDVIPSYPASYDCKNIISVAAINNYGDIAYFSNYGRESVDLAAPGVYIYSTKPNQDYIYASGTSMASPHVVGVAALLMSNGVEDIFEIKKYILSSIKPLESMNSKCVTGGMVNAFLALDASNNKNLHVVYTSPHNKEENVVNNIEIKVYFSKKVYEGYNYNEITLEKIDRRKVNLNKVIDNKCLILKPSAILESNTLYILKIPSNSIIDDSQESINELNIEFSTNDESFPYIISTEPENDQEGIPINKDIKIKFSEDINAGKNFYSNYSGIKLKDSNGSSITLSKKIDGDTLILKPKYIWAPLKANEEYTLTIPTDVVKDDVGNILEEDYILNFKTVVDELPYIISTEPENDQEGMPINKDIKIKFSEDINAGKNFYSNYSGIKLKDSNGSSITLSKKIDGDTLILKLKYSWAPLKANEEYTLTIPTDVVKDDVGNILEEDYILNFKTVVDELPL